MRPLAAFIAFGAWLFLLGRPLEAEVSPGTVLIAERAIATITIPGYADFLAADGRAIWATNEGGVEKLRVDRTSPVVTVPIPEPCGAMVVAFQSLWVANCQDSSVYRVDLKSQSISAKIPTGLADSSGELSLAAGAGSVWVLSDVSRIAQPRREDFPTSLP